MTQTEVKIVRRRVEEALEKVEPKPASPILLRTNYDTQIQFHDLTLPVEVLVHNLSKYANIPEWQRNVVWPGYRAQWLINTILQNGYITPCVLYPDPKRANKFFVLDGQQRIASISRFIAGNFKTGVKKTGRPGETYLEPGKLFHELSKDAQERILNFNLRLTVLQETDEDRLRQIYVNLQNLSPLKVAEVAYASNSRARDMALKIADHAFFGRIFKGDNLHYEHFQMALYPLAIEIRGGLLNLDKAQINGLANGLKDEDVNEEMLERIMERLDLINHLFAGVETKSTAAFIVMYQAVFLLSLAGYDLYNSQEGALTSWFNSLGATTSFASCFAQIYKAGYQHNFWSLRLAEIAKAPGIAEGFAQSHANIERFGLWMRNNHVCPRCNWSVPKMENISLHAFKVGDRCQMV